MTDLDPYAKSPDAGDAAASDLPDRHPESTATTYTYVDPDGHILRISPHPGTQAEVLITIQGPDDGLMVGASLPAEAAGPVADAILTDASTELDKLRAAHQSLQYTARCASALLREIDANTNTGRPQNIRAIRSAADALDAATTEDAPR